MRLRLIFGWMDWHGGFFCLSLDSLFDSIHPTTPENSLGDSVGLLEKMRAKSVKLLGVEVQRFLEVVLYGPVAVPNAVESRL